MNPQRRSYCVLLGLVLVCAMANGTSAQAQDGASPLADRLVRLTAYRFGIEPSCGVAFFAGSPGLLLTTYEAIRGAERLQVVTADGRDLTDRTRVANYSTIADLAVLHAEGEEPDSVPLGTNVAVGDLMSAWGFDDSMHASESPVSITSREGPLPHALYITDLGSGCRVGGPLVDRSQLAVGIVARQDAAIPTATALGLLATARQNVTTGKLLTVGDIAGTERHLYGSALLHADVPGSLVRVLPLESWHWPSLSEERNLPFTFNGPMGRYEVEFLSQRGVQNQSSFEIRPGAAIQIRLFPGAVAGGGGKKLPWVLGVLGAAGAGTAVLISGGGGQTEPPPPPPTTGSITVTFPKYIPRS